jgi:hypothetical protein
MLFKIAAQEDDSAFKTRASKRQRKDGERKRVTWNGGTGTLTPPGHLPKSL